MARAIKFRAWDRVNEEFKYAELTWGSDWAGTAGGFAFGSFDDYYIEKHGEPLVSQFTGLTDRNGVEIYEGDILGKRPYGYLKADGTKDGRYKGKEWQCFAVEWGEYDASESGLVSGYEYETDGKYAGWNIVVGGYDDDLTENEVIGNIYENPELLT